MFINSLLSKLKIVAWIFISITFSLLSLVSSFDDNRFYLSFCLLSQSMWQMFGLRVYLFGDELILLDNMLIMSNHRSMFDILSIFYVSGHYGRVVQFCLKRMVACIPGVGWWCWRLGFPILNRNRGDIVRLADARTTLPILIYPEGSRYTTRKHAVSAIYAKQQCLPISNYALLPKCKGSFILSRSRSVVYQMTLVYLDSNGLLLSGECTQCPSCIYIHVKKHSYVPENEVGFSQWTLRQFADIDYLYDNWKIPLDATEMKPKYYALDYLLYTAFASSTIMLFCYSICSFTGTD
jgi:1-acyl-sn-glycerol-3-phosphate acyltransferase